MVFFGANDASLPQAQNNQHIPLDEYTQNLENIITHPKVVAHKPLIILVTPPPINEHLQWITNKERGFESLSRVAPRTKGYADGACDVGRKLGVPVVDLWRAFMSRTGWDVNTWRRGQPIPGSVDVAQNDALVELMYDGGRRLKSSGHHDC